jgi:hypothetical protein
MHPDHLIIGAYYWAPDPGSKFEAAYKVQDVLRLQRAVAKHCTVPHEFVVVTDRPQMFDHVRNLIRPITLNYATHVPGTCFARLMTFHPEGQYMFGAERFLAIDLDTLIVGNIDHLVQRLENVVLWRNPARVPWEPLHGMPPGATGMTDRGENGQRKWLINQARCWFNTSVVFHKLGSMPHVWQVFNPTKPQAKDDQWYLSDLIGPGAPYFDGERDGVYRLAREDTPGSGVDGTLPDNACIVTFPGSHGKWTIPAIREANPWISAHLG